MPKLPPYRIDHITPKQERDFLRTWHYSKKTVPNSCVKLGCYLGSQLVGVATFGRIINCVPLFVRGCTNRDGLELNRLAMTDNAPKNSESFFLATCMRVLRKNYPWLKFIHTWADGLRCQGGTIYKACGFLYLRKQPIVQQYQLPNGECIHQIAFNQTYLKRYYTKLKSIAGHLEKVKAVFGNDVVEVTGGYNYNYVFLYDKGMAHDLAFVPQPYEKALRAGGESITAGVQSEVGGANPTPALQ